MEKNKCFIVKGINIDEVKSETYDIPETNRQINENCRGELTYLNEEAGITMRLGTIGANGYLAPHHSEGIVYLRILTGSGIIGIVDSEGKSICEIHAVEGDEIIFEEPMGLKYYKAEENGMSYRLIVFNG